MKITLKIISLILAAVLLLACLPVFAEEEACIITFNLNGGRCSYDEVSCVSGSSYTLPNKEPTKDGMVFRGWAKTAYDAAIGNIFVNAGGSLVITGDITLYASFAYEVTLKCGNEGEGNEEFILYKFPAKELALAHTKESVGSAYQMYSKNRDQRYFIQWNTAQDQTTSKGIGTAYRTAYTDNVSTTLYGIWGYAIQYNANGGTFPLNDSNYFATYVCDCDDVNYQNPKTLYGNFDFPEGDNLPIKEGSRLYTNKGQVFYGLLNSNKTFYTTESAEQNLTIPPTGGKLPWSNFHCSVTDEGNECPEFYAIWEPSFTYKANGGEGEDIVEYMSWNWKGVNTYNIYTVRDNSFTKDGAEFTGWNTMPDGSGKSYKPGSKKTSEKNAVILYAQWSDGSYGELVPTKSYLSFDANGGKNAPDSQIKYLGSDLEVTKDIPTRPGYIFLGWGDSRETTRVDYTPGSIFTLDEDLRLYALWQECDDHKFELASQTELVNCKTPVPYIYECTECSLSYEEWVKGEHEFEEYHYNEDASCTVDGTMLVKCKYCSEIKTVSAPGTALGHSFGEYVYDGNATCTAEGTMTAVCERCGSTDSIAHDPLGHTPGPWEEVISPDYVNTGVKIRSCTVCGEELEREEIPVTVLTMPFSDVAEHHWFYDAVYYCYVRNMISGMDEKTFAPNGDLTREQFLMILAKLDGADLKGYSDTATPFADVKDGAWYENAVNWAYAEGYSSGMSEDRFGIGQKITREQLARFFSLYAEKKGVDVSGRADLSAFSDAASVSPWAKENVEWAVSVKLISGMTDTELAPRGNATRAQAARMFMVFDNLISIN